MRRRPEGREGRVTAAVAAAAGIAVGAVTLYVARLLVARDQVSPPPAATDSDGEWPGPEAP